MAKKLWGARFKKKTDVDFEEFSKSIEYDYKLAEYDIYHSLIHIEALAEEGIITLAERRKLSSALESVLHQVERGKFKISAVSEDIHTDIQNKVDKKVGRLAHKLHTFRSRNEQIVFDEKFYCLKEAKEIYGLINEAIFSLNYLSHKYKGLFIPGYTHTQRAQVLAFSDYLGAFSYMLKGDSKRIEDFLKNTVIYVKSGALAGSPVKTSSYKKAIKRFLSKYKMKGINIEIAPNSVDNVSNRDFLIEFLSILSIIQMHLSRFSEDFILYSTKEFNFFDLPEEFCTGSSLMPQKKNPDFMELARGHTGRIYANLVSLLVTMKGLPLAYNRDMQLDKAPLFSSVQTIKDELKIMAKFIKKIKLNENVLDEALKDENLYATELAQFLVHKGVPFKDAHNIIGRLIKYSENEKVKIKDLPESVLKTFHRKLDSKSIKKIMNPRYSVLSKK